MVTLSPQVERCQHISSMPPASKRTVREPSSLLSVDWSRWKMNVEASRAAAASKRRTTLAGSSWNVPKERFAYRSRSNSGVGPLSLHGQIPDPSQSQADSFTVALLRHPVHGVERHGHQLGERLEIGE